MELHESMAYVEGCFREEPASCECACPFQLEIRNFLKKMARGRWPAAYRDLSAAIPFPTVAAALCPRPCEARCQRSVLGDAPLNMAALERACIGFATAERAQDFPLPQKNQRIAVVGAGPAGLACALALARKKYQVTVFDSAPGWGGHLRSHEAFDIFDGDFQKQFAPQNVDFRFGETADEAALSGFDAVYVATGDPAADFGLAESWNRELFTTARPGWFMGGGVVGMPLMESMAAARKLSQLIEAYLQTGRAALIVEKDSACDGHFVAHPGECSKARVEAADGMNYTKDEAKAEAARCMQCVCDGCMSGCELMAHYRKSPLKLATDISGDSHTAPPFSNCAATRQTYSCNQCGACADRCPEGIDLGALFRFSREDRWQRGKWIPGMYDYWLRTLDFHGETGFYASKSSCDAVFFPGCQLTATKPEQVLAAWRFLRMQGDVGVILGCCGVPAVWAGDLTRKERNLAQLREHWEAMGRPQIITACATCADQLRKQLPEAPLRSLYEVLGESDAAPTAQLPFEEAAVFDPCAARGDVLLRRSVQKLAERAGCTVEQLPDSGNCCGYGGHMRLANPELYKEITDHRSSESDKPYLVYCANCLEVFRSKGKAVAHILDAVFPGETDVVPSLEQKRKNTLRVKASMMKELENKDFLPEPAVWDGLKLAFSEDARANMEDKLITDSDVAEAIFTAERENDYFEDENGLRTACLMKKVLTYWVDYRPLPEGAYRVEAAYCHRMRIGEEQKA